MAARQVQKLSVAEAPGDACPVRPASARWNACECRFGMPGTSGPAVRVAARGRHVRFDLRDDAVRVDVDRHVARPPRRKQRVVGVQSHMCEVDRRDEGDGIRRQRIDGELHRRVVVRDEKAWSAVTASGAWPASRHSHAPVTA